MGKKKKTKNVKTRETSLAGVVASPINGDETS